MVIEESCPKADDMCPVVRLYPRFPDISKGASVHFYPVWIVPLYALHIYDILYRFSTVLPLLAISGSSGSLDYRSAFVHNVLFNSNRKHVIVNIHHYNSVRALVISCIPARTTNSLFNLHQT